MSCVFMLHSLHDILILPSPRPRNDKMTPNTKGKQMTFDHIHDQAALEEAYNEAVAPARKAYNEAVAPARKAYVEATAPALKAYVEATAPAQKAYEEAEAPALKAYEEARSRITMEQYAS